MSESLRDQIARAAQYAPHAPDEGDPWLTVADAVLPLVEAAIERRTADWMQVQHGTEQEVMGQTTAIRGLIAKANAAEARVAALTAERDEAWDAVASSVARAANRVAAAEARLVEVTAERDEARQRCDEYVALRGWCGFEDQEGRIAMAHGGEALMIATRSAAEPFAVYRRMIALAAAAPKEDTAPGGES